MTKRQSFGQLPVELLLDVCNYALEGDMTLKERQSFLAGLCRTERALVPIARPKLYEKIHLHLKTDFRRKCDTERRRYDESKSVALIRTLTEEPALAALVETLRISTHHGLFVIENEAIGVDGEILARVLQNLNLDTIYLDARQQGIVYEGDEFFEALFETQPKLKTLIVPNLLLQSQLVVEVHRKLQHLTTFECNTIRTPDPKLYTLASTKSEPVVGPSLENLIVNFPLQPALSFLVQSSFESLVSLDLFAPTGPLVVPLLPNLRFLNLVSRQDPTKCHPRLPATNQTRPRFDAPLPPSLLPLLSSISRLPSLTHYRLAIESQISFARTPLPLPPRSLVRYSLELSEYFGFPLSDLCRQRPNLRHIRFSYPPRHSSQDGGVLNETYFGDGQVADKLGERGIEFEWGDRMDSIVELLSDEDYPAHRDVDPDESDNTDDEEYCDECRK